SRPARDRRRPGAYRVPRLPHPRRRVRAYRRPRSSPLLRLPGGREPVPERRLAPAPLSGLTVFAYASLVDPTSVRQTLGHDVEPVPARLAGWRRRWSGARGHRDADTPLAP